MRKSIPVSNCHTVFGQPGNRKLSGSTHSLWQVRTTGTFECKELKKKKKHSSVLLSHGLWLARKQKTFWKQALSLADQNKGNFLMQGTIESFLGHHTVFGTPRNWNISDALQSLADQDTKSFSVPYTLFLRNENRKISRVLFKSFTSLNIYGQQGPLVIKLFFMLNWTWNLSCS